MSEEKNHAPGDLRLIEQLVNSVELDDDREDLATPEALGAWLRERGLAEEGEVFSHDDRARTVAFREALRALLLTNTEGGELDPGALATLNDAGRGAAQVVTLDATGRARLQPECGGIDRVFGRLLTIVTRAQAEGSWERLKACPWHTCHWAFYDHSRNHSRTWCSMRVCGNRAKAQTYRRRRA